MSAASRFAITLSWGMRVSLTLYPLSRNETAAATLMFPGCTMPVCSFFMTSECKVVPPLADSHLPWALWLGSVCIEISEAEGHEIEAFLTAVRAGQQVDA